MPKIEKGIPIPPKNETEGVTSDLRDLLAADIGDSIFFPVPEGMTISKFSTRMTSSISKIGKGWATQRQDSVSEPDPSPMPEGHAQGMLVTHGIRVWKKADLETPTSQ